MQSELIQNIFLVVIRKDCSLDNNLNVMTFEISRKILYRFL